MYYVYRVFYYMDSEDILKHYLGIEQVPVTIKSPFRNEKSASFTLYRTRAGKVKFKDLADGSIGDGIDYVRRYYNLSYNEAMDKIAREVRTKKSHTKPNTGRRHIKLIPTKHSKFPKHFIDYWKQYLLTPQDIINEGNVSSLLKFSYNNKTIWSNRSVMICYEWKYKGKIYYKIYQPYNKKFKFLNNLSSVSNILLHNIDKLDKTLDYLIITKSVKDVMIIKKCGYINVIGTQSEGINIDKRLMNKFISTFKHIYILYDNDHEKEINRGQEYAKTILKQYNKINNIVLPSLKGVTDSSDLVKQTQSFKQLKQTLKSIKQ